MLTVLVAILAAGGVLTGLAGYLRARWRRLATWRPVTLVAAAGTALVLPDGYDGTLATDAAAGVYRAGALGWLGVVAVVMALTSARVLDPIRDRLAALRPSRRRRPGFPTTFDALVEHDRQLTRRLLSYEHDLEMAVNAPVMRDYTDPRTAAAVHAMLHCDVVRPATAPTGRDLSRTEYGQAVIAFEEALVAAEANAARLARSTFTDDERRALDEAARSLQFMREHATTPAERDAAYARVRELLERHPRGGAVPAQAARPHPFLTIDERAAR